MDRTLATFLFSSVWFFGCAESTGFDTAQFTADAKDERTSTLLSVTYEGSAAEVAIQIVQLGMDGTEVVYLMGEILDGVATIALPSVPPMAPGEADVEYRVVARLMEPSGRMAGIVDIADLPLVFRSSPSTTTQPGWYLRDTNETGVDLWLPVSGGLVVDDRLALVPRISVRGQLDRELMASPFRLAMVTDGDARMSALTSAAFVMDADLWSMPMFGPPPLPSMITDSGPASGHFWPVAYADVDGIAGLDPDADTILGLACVPTGVVAAIWSPVPLRVGDALDMMHLGLRPGWSVKVEGPAGMSDIPRGLTPYLSGTCL